MPWGKGRAGAGGVAIGDAVSSGTEGSVLFLGVGGILAQDNSNIYWDDTNNKFCLGTTTSKYRLTVKDAAAPQAIFYGWSSIGGDGTHKVDNGNGMFQLGLNATDHFELIFDDWGQSGNTHTYFDSTYDSVSAAMSFRFRTSGTPVVALSLIASGAVGIGATATTGQGLLIANSSVQQLYARGWASLNGASTFDGQISLGSYCIMQGISNYPGGATAILLDNPYDDPLNYIIFRHRTTGTTVISLQAYGSGKVKVRNGQTSSGQAALGGTIFDHFADVGNVGTGEDDLYSDTLPASTLGTNGDKVVAQYSLVFVSSATATRQVRAYFGGTLILDTGTLTFGSTGAADVWITVVRESSSVVRCIAEVVVSGLTLQPIAQYTRITGLTLSNTQILKITGEAAGVGAATDDIIAKLGYVEWKSAA